MVKVISHLSQERAWHANAGHGVLAAIRYIPFRSYKGLKGLPIFEECLSLHYSFFAQVVVNNPVFPYPKPKTFDMYRQMYFDGVIACCEAELKRPVPLLERIFRYNRNERLKWRTEVESILQRYKGAKKDCARHTVFSIYP